MKNIRSDLMYLLVPAKPQVDSLITIFCDRSLFCLLYPTPGQEENPAYYRKKAKAFCPTKHSGRKNGVPL